MAGARLALVALALARPGMSWLVVAAMLTAVLLSAALGLARTIRAVLSLIAGDIPPVLPHSVLFLRHSMLLLLVHR